MESIRGVDLAGTFPIALLILASPFLWSWFNTWLTKRITAGVEHQFGIRIQEHKHSLDLQSAAAGFEYQRKLQEFNLFVTKKHEAIARLYALLHHASALIQDAVRRHRHYARLEDTNVVDATEYLTNHAKIPAGKRSEILALWDSDREGAQEILHKYQDGMQGEHARRAFAKANNYRILHDLYLPEQISVVAETLARRLGWLLPYTDSERPEMSPAVYEELGMVRAEMELLRARMRAEMMDPGGHDDEDAGTT